MYLHHKSMFYEVLEAQRRPESLEIATKSRTRNIVHFENIYIISVTEIPFEFLHFVYFGADIHVNVDCDDDGGSGYNC